jgi:hypothetical protein
MRYEVSQLEKEVALPAFLYNRSYLHFSHNSGYITYYSANNTIKREGTASPLDSAKTPPPGRT